MPTAIDLFQIVYQFDASDGSSLPLGPSPFIGLVQEPQQSPEARGSITLPNGAKYDPYQTYDSPTTPGILTFRRLLKHPGTYTLEDTEKYISNWYNYNVIPMVGKRGTLAGTSHDVPTSSATARLLQVSLDWNLPRQIVANIGGSGNATPGIKTALLTLRFDLLSTWTYTT